MAASHSSGTPGDGAFQTVDIPDTTVNGSFFIGAALTTGVGQGPFSLDTDTPQQRSYYAQSAMPGEGNVADLSTYSPPRT